MPAPPRRRCTGRDRLAGPPDPARPRQAVLLLHGRPTAFLAACRNGTQAAWGIILQLPFYGGIHGVLHHTGLGRWRRRS